MFLLSICVETLQIFVSVFPCLMMSVLPCLVVEVDVGLLLCADCTFDYDPSFGIFKEAVESAHLWTSDQIRVCPKRGREGGWARGSLVITF